MTDLMKLHDEAVAAALDVAARSLGDRDNKTRAALQSAIEALQSENAEHKENAMRNARQAVAFRAERDQLQAKVDAMSKGEAVAGTVEILLEAAEVLDKVRSQCDDAWERFGLRDYLPDELHGTALIVRDAAPKAWAIFTADGNARMWSTYRPHVQKLAVAEGLKITALYAEMPVPARADVSLTNEGDMPQAQGGGVIRYHTHYPSGPNDGTRRVGGWSYIDASQAKFYADALASADCVERFEPVQPLKVTDLGRYALEPHAPKGVKS